MKGLLFIEGHLYLPKWQSASDLDIAWPSNTKNSREMKFSRTQQSRITCPCSQHQLYFCKSKNCIAFFIKKLYLICLYVLSENNTYLHLIFLARFEYSLKMISLLVNRGYLFFAGSVKSKITSKTWITPAFHLLSPL